MGLGKTAATLALHLVNPAKTPSEGVPLDEKEWGNISGAQVRVRVVRSAQGSTCATDDDLFTYYYRYCTVDPILLL